MSENKGVQIPVDMQIKWATSDKRYPKMNLHNYFFAHGLDVLKPGGLMVAITSAHTMDSSIGQREYLAGKGLLVGAIRLPNNAFKANAGTEVVTDIVILRKPVDSKDIHGESRKESELFSDETALILAEVGERT